MMAPAGRKRAGKSWSEVCPVQDSQVTGKAAQHCAGESDREATCAWPAARGDGRKRGRS